MSSTQSAEHIKRAAHTRKRFTREDDKKLKMLVEKYGANWKKIEENFDDRCARQLKDRWNYCLNPNLNAAPFTFQEDLLLYKLLQNIGNKWRTIAEFFPGRSDVALKNRWKMIQRHNKKNNNTPNAVKPPAPEASSPTDFNLDDFNFDESYDVFDHFFMQN
jgi:hypothetical protein